MIYEKLVREQALLCHPTCLEWVIKEYLDEKVNLTALRNSWA